MKFGINIKKLLNLFSVIIVCGVIFAIISPVQTKMNRIIAKHKLTDTNPVKNAPPTVAFVVMVLGSFRGLLADLLWLRAINLQDQGKYFEMVQLASWMTKLQPRFTGAAAYLAWNMAYNISVTCSSPADRWRWVQRGVELLRDEALKYNPGDPILYKELGWIFQHKIGDIMDDANIYYKNHMAVALMKAFGGPDPDWELLAKAPKTEKELTRALLKIDKNFFVKLKKTKFSSLTEVEKTFREGGKLPESILSLFSDKAIALLDTYLRTKWIKEVYKLDPSVILEINKKYGELDWRLPESQAIYWATLGLKHSRTGKNLDCQRMITQSLKIAFMAGRLLIVDKKNYRTVLTIPNINVVDAVRDTYMKAYEDNKNTGAANSFLSAWENFMKDAIVILYTFGNYSKAKKYYKILSKRFPGNKSYRQPLDMFVLKEWSEDVREASMKQAMDIISGLLYRFCSLLAFGNIQAASGHEGLARFAYKIYMRSQKGIEQRTGLPPYKSIKKNIIKGCLKNFPPILAENLKNALKSLQTSEKREK